MNKEEKQMGFMELLDCVLDSVQHVRNNQNFDWIRKYGNIFLSVSIDKLDEAMRINEYQKTTRTKEELENILNKINLIVETDFCEEMTTLVLPETREYTQEEAKEMATLLGSVYHYAHQVHCVAHQREVTGVFKSKEEIDKFFFEKYNV